MAKITNPDDQMFSDGTTLKAYRQGLVDRFTGQGLTTEKVIEAAKAVESYIVEATTDEDRAQRRSNIERQLGMHGDATKALAATKALDAYVSGKAA